MLRVVLSIIALCLVLSAAASAGEPQLVNLWLPGHDWAFQFDNTGFHSAGHEIADDMRGRSFKTSDLQERVIIQVKMETTTGGMTSAEYREACLKEQEAWPVHREGFNKYERDGIAFVEYIQGSLTEDYDGRQPNARAYYVRDSIRVDFWIASNHVWPEYEKIFEQVLGSLKIIEDYQPNSWDFAALASKAYLMHDYKAAIPYYEKSLALEKQKRGLKHWVWVVMVDNLGMAYCLSGDRPNGRRVFEYGLSVEPEYPMFHYNLACYFAEEKKLDSAMVELAKAYEYEANMLEGEEIPDPYKDESFRRYWNNRDFNRFMREVRK